MEIKRLIFADPLKQRYFVRRDDCGGEYLSLRGPKALGALGTGGLDHIYLIGPGTLGLWITSGTIKSTVRRLQGTVPGMNVELLGDSEAVLSAPLSQLDELCRAAGARNRPRYSEEALSRKRQAA